jgi:hypothetical protein
MATIFQNLVVNYLYIGYQKSKEPKLGPEIALTIGQLILGERFKLI